MKLKQEEIKYIAKLAYLKLTPIKIEKLTLEINNILIHINKLVKIDTTNISCTNYSLMSNIIMRQDKIQFNIYWSEILANAPQTNNEKFVVPKIITRS